MFMIRQGRILGHIVSKNETSMDQDKFKLFCNYLDQPIEKKYKGSWAIVDITEGSSFILQK